MATKREMEIAVYFAHLFADKIPACASYYETELDEYFPHNIEEERKEFDGMLHLLDEARLITFPNSEEQLEAMWQLWKAAREIE